MPLMFYALPLFFVLVIGPIVVALRANSANAWFATQLLSLVGLIVAIVLIHRESFGDLAAVMQFALLVIGAGSGLLAGSLIFRRAPQTK